MQDKDYPAAFAEYQSAVKLNPQSASIYNRLGEAALRSGNTSAGLAALDKAVELDPALANDVAYELAQEYQSLDKAVALVKRAVSMADERSKSFSLDTLEPDDLRTITQLGNSWDTLGWVYFRRGELDDAENFLIAAWNLSQHPIMADHLGQVYERRKLPNKAAEMYALALAGSDRMSETRSRLAKLLGSEAKMEQQVSAARDKISRLREFKIPRKPGQKGSAEFFVLLSPGSKVDGVKFVSGEESLRASTLDIGSAKFDATLPDQSSTRLVRRGILDCTSLGCSFVLYRPDDVHSVE